MAEKNLHPSVKKFKEFVRNHPHLMNEVKSGEKTLQELFEEWYLLGEDDPKWKETSTKKNDKSEENETDGETTDLIRNLLSSIKNIDIQQLQKHIGTVQNAIQSFQEIIGQFQPTEAEKQERKNGPHHLFSFRKD